MSINAITKKHLLTWQVVALAPRYVIVNAMDRSIEVQQAGLIGDFEPMKVGGAAA